MKEKTDQKEVEYVFCQRKKAEKAEKDKWTDRKYLIYFFNPFESFNKVIFTI